MSVTCPGHSGRRTGRYRFAGRGLVVRDCAPPDGRCGEAVVLPPPPESWSTAPPAIPLSAGRRRRGCGSNRILAWRPSTAGRLSVAPIELRISGITDVPNACVTLYLPLDIFDQGILPHD